MSYWAYVEAGTLVLGCIVLGAAIGALIAWVKGA